MKDCYYSTASNRLFFLYPPTHPPTVRRPLEVLQKPLNEVLGLAIRVGNPLPHVRLLSNGRRGSAVHGGGGGEDCGKVGGLVEENEAVRMS